MTTELQISVLKGLAVFGLLVIIAALQKGSLDYLPPDTVDKGRYCLNIATHRFARPQFDHIIFAIFACQSVGIVAFHCLARRASRVIGMVAISVMPLFWPRLVVMCG